MSRRFLVVALALVLGFATASAALAKDKQSARKDSQAAAQQPKQAAKQPSPKTDDPFAHDEKPSAKKKPAAKRPLAVGEAAIEKALGEPTELEFVETPLTDVIDCLKEHHRIEIQLDYKTLSDVGIGNDSPITKNLKGVSLRSGLNLTLRELNLTWLIKDEVLLITTPEEAEAQLITKVYDVADLVACRDEDDEPWDDYDTLIDAIDSTVMPATWDAVGGPGSIACGTLGTAKVLVISQTYNGHREIAKLLDDIRAIGKKHADWQSPRREKKPDSQEAQPAAAQGRASKPDAGGRRSKDDSHNRDGSKPSGRMGGGTGMF